MGNHDDDALDRYSRGDRAVAALGIQTVEVTQGRAVVRMEVTDRHCDASGRLARGHAFTVADAAVALASNSYGPVALLVHADVEWLEDTAAGSVVTATCEVVQRSVDRATFVSRVVDDGGHAIGVVTGTTRTPRG
jgi:acyl-CoA thioesterase